MIVWLGVVPALHLSGVIPPRTHAVATTLTAATAVGWPLTLWWLSGDWRPAAIGAAGCSILLSPFFVPSSWPLSVLHYNPSADYRWVRLIVLVIGAALLLISSTWSFSLGRRRGYLRPPPVTWRRAPPGQDGRD
jgi:hypothetical protein